MNILDQAIERWIRSIDRERFKPLLYFLIFGFFGITVEVFFSGFFEPYIKYPGIDSELTFRGISYPWMLPIHGLVPLLFTIGYRFIGRYFVLIRMLFYMVGVFVIEFASGFLLEKITGSCPWHYNTEYHFMHYIRWDFAPWWMLYGLLAETLLKILNHFFGSEKKPLL